MFDLVIMMLELADPLPALELITNLTLTLMSNPATNLFLAVNKGLFKKIALVLGGNNQPKILETSLKLLRVMMIDMGGARDDQLSHLFESQGCLDAVERLMYDKNGSVAESSKDLIKFWNESTVQLMTDYDPTTPLII